MRTQGMVSWKIRVSNSAYIFIEQMVMGLGHLSLFLDFPFSLVFQLSCPSYIQGMDQELDCILKYNL